MAFLLAFACCVSQVKVHVSHFHPYALSCSLFFGDAELTQRTSFKTLHNHHPLNYSYMPTVPSIPFPLIPEEMHGLHSVECDYPMQCLFVWPEELVAAAIPCVRRIPLHRPHCLPQAPGKTK